MYVGLCMYVHIIIIYAIMHPEEHAQGIYRPTIIALTDGDVMIPNFAMRYVSRYLGHYYDRERAHISSVFCSLPFQHVVCKKHCCITMCCCVENELF